MLSYITFSLIAILAFWLLVRINYGEKIFLPILFLIFSFSFLFCESINIHGEALSNIVLKEIIIFIDYIGNKLLKFFYLKTTFSLYSKIDTYFRKGILTSENISLSLLLYICTVLGIFLKELIYPFSKKSKIKKERKRTIISLILAPFSFVLIWTLFLKNEISLLVYIFSFENGFLWKNIGKKR